MSDFGRVSSTPLTTWGDCNRKFAFQFQPTEYMRQVGATFQPNEAMAIGTLIHAVLEWRGENSGAEPTIEDIRTMEGNYDPPSKAMDDFPRAWKVAQDTLAELPELQNPVTRVLRDLNIPVPYEFINEFDAERLGIEVDGVTCGGYVDLLLYPASQANWGKYPIIVWDWKTRGSLRYAPMHAADFRQNVQLCYYPALIVAAGMHRHPKTGKVAPVVVGHGNIIRKKRGVKPKYIPRHAALPTWFLEDAWQGFEADIRAMKAALEGPASAVTPNVDACFKYGRCDYFSVCPSGGQPPTSFRDRLKRGRGEGADPHMLRKLKEY
jgi:hypothetical protein